MSENADERSHYSEGVKESIMMILDSSEDEDESSSIGNKLTNAGYYRRKAAKIGDHSSDYGGHRTQMTKLDNKSISSGQDYCGIFGLDGSSQDEGDKSSSYWAPSAESEFHNIPQNNTDRPWSDSNAAISDNQYDNFTQEKLPTKLILGEYEGAPEICDRLSKYTDDYANSTLRIECYPGQLSKEGIQTIFSQHTYISKIELIEPSSETVHSTFFPSLKPIHPRKAKYQNQAFGNFASPEPTSKYQARHHKSKSLSEDKKSKEKLEELRGNNFKKNKNQNKKNSSQK